MRLAPIKLFIQGISEILISLRDRVMYAKKKMSIKVYLRPLLFRVKEKCFFLIARFPFKIKYHSAYILGCGRSGTTIIGNSIGSDAEIAYLNEPYYVWYNVSPKTDFSNLFKKGGESWLSPGDVNKEQRSRLQNTFSFLSMVKSRKHIVEKTPVNSLRILWLKSLDPTARFVLVRRYWVDVVNSIIDLCSDDPYAVGARKYHTWWGEGNFKVKSLIAREPYGLASPEFKRFVKECLDKNDQNSVDLNMAVFEALASHVAIESVLKTHSELRKDVIEIEYDRFIDAPYNEISRVVTWIKMGQIPKLNPSLMPDVKRRRKKGRNSKDDILQNIHPDLRKAVEQHLD